MLAFVLDTTSVVATRFALTEDEDERASRCRLLMECVSIFAADERARSQAPHRRHDRVLSCDGSRAFSFVSSRRVTATGRYWSDKQGDGTRRRLDWKRDLPEELKSELVYPSKVPWSGYRVDLIAIIGNAAFNRARVCDDVANLGGLPIVLNHTRG